MQIQMVLWIDIPKTHYSIGMSAFVEDVRVNKEKIRHENKPMAGIALYHNMKNWKKSRSLLKRRQKEYWRNWDSQTQNSTMSCSI